jgi:hypothetical protein
MPSRDPNRGGSRASRGLRRNAGEREALSDFAETRGDMNERTQTAFAEAEGAKARAKSRRIGALHFAAHVLLLALALCFAGAGLVYFSVSALISGTARTPWFVLHTTSSQVLFNFVALVLAAGGAVSLFVALYFFSKLGAASRERSRFAAALPRAFRPARVSLLVALWLLAGLILLYWTYFR